MAADRTGAAVQPAPRRGLRRVAKPAGGIVTTLVVLDLVAAAVAVWFGAGFLKP